MTAWTRDELAAIENTDELEIASLRADDTLGPYRVVWVVQVGQALYVRSVNGSEAAWFRGTRGRHEGRIRAGGVDSHRGSGRAFVSRWFRRRRTSSWAVL
jgi:hypothetical protein